MFGKVIWLLAVLASGLEVFGAIDPDLPSPAPKVNGAFPHGAARGSTTEVELKGLNLHDTIAVEFAGRGVQADLLSATATKVKLKVRVDETAETGRRDYWLRTKRGSYIGVFDIGALREIREVEGNDDFRKPQRVQLPLLVNGIIGSEDWDHFSFEAAAGETLVFDVSATRHGSRLDADLAILDPNGEELAWVDDTTIFGDPHLEYTFQQAGTYLVRVGSLAGGASSDYRLAAGRLPYVRRILPAGLGSGQTTTVTLTGTHLDLVDEVWVGDKAAKAEIVGKSPSELRASVQLPADFPVGRYRLHALSKGLEIPMATEIQVSSLPEITISKAPTSPAVAVAVTPSAVVNGVIESPKQSHYFKFQARAGETFVFRSESMKLGYHLDPTITLMDATGSKLAYADDPGGDDRADEYQLDPDLSYSFTKDGTYLLAIRDGMYRGGDQLLYRLSIERTPPDFIAEIREPVKTLYEGQEDTIQVRIRRRAGWSAPVEVWAEGLPVGVSSEKRLAEPKNSIVKDTCGVDREIDGTIVLIPVRVHGATGGRSPFQIKARGVMNGRTVEHTAIVRYENAAAGYVYGPMQVQRAELAITEPQRVWMTTPEVVSVAPGATGVLKTSVRRFGDAKGSVLKLRIRGQGIEAAPISVAPDAKEATFTVSAASRNNGDVSVVVEAVSEDGQTILGESAPVTVRITPEQKASNR